MSRHLYLLPITYTSRKLEGSLYSFTVLDMPNDDDTLNRIAELPSELVTDSVFFQSHMGDPVPEEDCRSFGHTVKDQTGRSIRIVTGGAITGINWGSIPREAYELRAALAYLKALPPDVKVALFWS